MPSSRAQWSPPSAALSRGRGETRLPQCSARTRLVLVPGARLRADLRRARAPWN
ncbi:MAG: hypothetical protein LBP92_14575 [Deltaproteobacteria bacterium]|nr:hypothetical protein [Deltaproteobacteria bacterium]